MAKRHSPLKADAARGLYYRSIGWKLDAKGRRVQPKFRLGRDRPTAQLAYDRLGALWDVVVAEHERREGPPHGTFEPPGAEHDTGPLWDETTLQLAEAIRKGQHTIVVGPNDSRSDDNVYVNWLADLRQRFGHIIAIVPADAEAAERGREHYQDLVRHRATLTAAAAKVADVPIPVGVTGTTLYQAIDTYADHQREHKQTEGARVEAANARRLKDAIRDMDLAEFGYSAMEKLKLYWAGRPKSKATGQPISLTTVDNHLSTARRFANWLDRSSEHDWEMPRHGLDAMKVNLKRLRTGSEISAQRNGVAIFTVAELATLYRHATERERLFMILALNTGGAHAELRTLRRDEVEREAQPPAIKRIRHKSGVYGEFALWPETLKAIDRHLAQPQHKHRPKDRPELLLTGQGRPYTRQQIATAWAHLLNRVAKEEPSFRRLSFKHLRKTAGQMVRRHSDGEIAGVFLCHGQPVKSDELSDVYTNRPFDKAAEALAKVREDLQPMFNLAPLPSQTRSAQGQTY